ncbi:MAG: hypothetical protein O7J95_07255 [Planctomycetota bacterium]|nr:hypothetical protein [Planctomycetota bacterium]
MKAIGFFLAVFVGMLAVFLVATGEVNRWFSSGQEPEDVMKGSFAADDAEEGKNQLNFEYWDPEEGRRRFIIRAELSQETLDNADAIEELHEISLKDGVIEVPYPGKTPGAPLEELVIEFKSAVYRKGDGLASGKMPLFARLRNGKGTTNEGTEFYFEELLFFQDEKDRGRFGISSSKKVRIVRSSSLEVHSPAGFEGSIGESGNFDRLEFRPPVYTYIEPRLIGFFGDDPAEHEPAGPRRDRVGGGTRRGRRVAVTCAGPLTIVFDEPPLGGEDPPASRTGPRQLMRVTFSGDVKIFEVERVPESGPPPPPGEKSFECQTLQLEIDDSSVKPSPSYALATTEGGRVVARFGGGGKSFLLEGDRLEWVKLGSGSQDSGRSSEAVLSGNPHLVGENIELDAERAILRPADDRIVLEQVVGVLVRPLAKEPGEGELPPGKRTRSAPGGGGDRGLAVEKLDFRADQVEIFFTTAGDDDAGSSFSHFIARSKMPRGVIIERRLDDGKAGGEEALGFRASGKTLRYRESDKRLTLEGSARELPRLSRGTSWIEAEKLTIVSGGRHAWFDGRVNAHFDEMPRLAEADGAAGSKEPGGAKEPGKERDRLPEAFEIKADFLEVFFEKNALHSVKARGGPFEPVKVTTFADPGYIFEAPRVDLDMREKVAVLTGDRPEGKPPRLARVEFDGGEARAGRIRFARRTWQCRLEDGVQLKLGRAKKRGASPPLEILAAEADVTFTPGFRRSEPAAAGALSQLDPIRQFHAIKGERGELVVRGETFLLRGEEATWDYEQRELRFFGRDVQIVELDHPQLRGPIEAREIVFDRSTNVLTLEGNVKGILHQAPRRRATPSPRPATSPAEAGESLKWEFETSVLEIEFAAEAPGGDLELIRLRARDKVLLRNPDNGLKLRGDDLLYEHREGRVRVFSREGRLQTLVRQRPDVARRMGPGGLSPKALEDAGAVDKIRSQEIQLYLHPQSADRSVVIVEFAKEVQASFLVPGNKASRLGTGEDDHWELEAQSLTLYLDSRQDQSRPRLLQAVATGEVQFASSGTRAEAERAEYDEDERRLRLLGSPASVTVKKGGTPGRSWTEKHPEIVFHKNGDEIRVTYRGRVRRGQRLRRRAGR